MPQKRNPRRSQRIISTSARIKALVPLSLESMQEEHEADASGHHMIDAALDEVCILTSKYITSFIDLFSGLQLFPDRMRENLELSGGLIMSEQIMLELGNEMGRQKAHDVVYDAAQKSVNESRPFRETLAEEQDVTSRLSAAEIETLLDPEKYTGLCEYFAETFARKGREIAALITTK